MAGVLSGNPSYSVVAFCCFSVFSFYTFLLFYRRRISPFMGLVHSRSSVPFPLLLSLSVLFYFLLISF